MGPDMGYLGGYGLLTDLAHYIQATDLARAMTMTTENDRDLAFAWGWVSHIVSDVIVHPIINAAVGRQANSAPMSYADDPTAHIRVEMGHDAYYAARRRMVGVKPVYSTENNAFVRALHSTYGSYIDARRVLRCHRKATKRVQLALQVSSVNSRRNSSPANISWQSRALHVVLKALSNGRTTSLLHAITRPIPPDSQLIESMPLAEQQIMETFFKCADDNLATLPNYNLDLGVVEHSPEDKSYALTQRTRQFVANQGTPSSRSLAR